MAEKRFWTVYVGGRGAPSYKYASKEEAQNEAKRLVQSSSEIHAAYVLEAICVARRTEPPVIVEEFAKEEA